MNYEEGRFFEVFGKLDDDILHYTAINIDGKTATYDEVSIDSGKLKNYIGEQYQQDTLSSGESTYGTRFIKITLADGSTIDSWKYDAIYGTGISSAHVINFDCPYGPPPLF